MKAPKFTCPEIARVESFLLDKLDTKDFKYVEGQMDKIRDINYELRQYGHFWRRKQIRKRPIRKMKRK